LSAEASPVIRAASKSIDPTAQFGPNVAIEADEVVIGPGARIGFSDDDDFRTPPGVRIKAARLELGSNVQIGRAVRIHGGQIKLDDGVRILRHTSIEIRDRLHIGAHGSVHERCEISGRNVSIGQELWMLPGAKIGGGSAFELSSSFVAGHYLHLGVDALVNTAREVHIGHEVGLGTRTAIYTHGAYASALRGFPVAFEGVSIGDFTWIPGAVVNPGVSIGRNCVVGVNSLVTRNLPDGCLAAGSPATVIRESRYPKPLSTPERHAFFESFLERYSKLLGTSSPVVQRSGGTLTCRSEDVIYVALPADDSAPAFDGLDPSGFRTIVIGENLGAGEVPEGWTLLDLASRKVRGQADASSERFLNELRRHGIRFYSRLDRDVYQDWERNPPSP
jgi:acetyltransferase-like isoleucine patch superfamily enzyme